MIRHGQASFLADDYDVLSERGIEQSSLLGDHVVAHGLKLDAIYTGPRKRQVDTAAHMIDRARIGGTELPDAQRLDAFDEYPFEALMKRALPKLLEDPELAALWNGTGDRRHSMSVFIEKVTAKWSAGEIDVGDEIESFEHFHGRVTAGLDEVMQREGRGKSVAVVTSGGPISQSVKRALNLDQERTWKASWVIRNASISEFMYRDDSFSLVSFNATPHLSGTLLTFR